MAKTTALTTGKKMVQVKQPHGGALNLGGTPGNKGGGSAPSELRRIMRGHLS